MLALAKIAMSLVIAKANKSIQLANEMGDLLTTAAQVGSHTQHASVTDKAKKNTASASKDGYVGVNKTSYTKQGISDPHKPIPVAASQSTSTKGYSLLKNPLFLAGCGVAVYLMFFRQ